MRKNEERAWEERDHSLFVGYAPYDSPRYAVAVVIEHGGSSKHAAALAKSIMDETVSGEHGYWMGLGEDPTDGRQITSLEWLDRMAPGAAAVLAIGTLLFAGPLSDWLESVRAGYVEADALGAGYAWSLFLVAMVIILPATFCGGMLMPILGRLALSDRESIGRHTGAVYAASTLGAVLAPPAAAFWLLPSFGVTGTIAAIRPKGIV